MSHATATESKALPEARSREGALRLEVDALERAIEGAEAVLSIFILSSIQRGVV